jgi:hypothetical protein
MRTKEEKIKRKTSDKTYREKPEVKAYHKAYRENPKNKAKRKIYLAKPEYKRNEKNRQLRIKFGITSEQYTEMFIKQNGCCAICNKNQNEFKRKLAVDHDHKTGKIRGLLCSNCNTILGKLNDNSETLLNAIQYLNKYKVF